MIRDMPSSSQDDAQTSDKTFTVSDDGYIRLSFGELQSVNLRHLISGLDEDMPTDISAGAVIAMITGFTEWITPKSPAITIGWDWKMHVAHNRVQLQRVGDPRSNIMLQDKDRVDVGPTKTALLLEVWIDTLDWESQVQKYIDINYGP